MMGYNYSLGCIPCREYINVGQDGCDIWQNQETMAFITEFLKRHKNHTLIYTGDYNVEEWHWVASAFDLSDENLEKEKSGPYLSKYTVNTLPDDFDPPG
jgi:hypothetical protein